MQFMDTHIHLQDFSAKNTTNIIADAEKAGVNRFICVSSKENNWQQVLNLAADYPGKIIPAAGLHPWYIGEVNPGWEERLEQSLAENPQLLVGECGLDRLKNPVYEAQKAVFEAQIKLAKKYDRTILIHAVKAAEWLEDFWEILPERFVFHAFNGRFELLEKVVKNGGYAAFGFGIFGNRDQEKILRYIPEERILFETDSPYLARIRGEENRPEYLPEIALKIAEIRRCPVENLCAKVYDNSLTIAGIQ